MSWRDLEASVPEIARLGKERLDQARVALLATLCKDGSPRISPVEPYLSQGHLLFGALSWSLKTRDLLRDSRCVLHSAATGPDNGEGELKLLAAEGFLRRSVRESRRRARRHVGPVAVREGRMTNRRHQRHLYGRYRLRSVEHARGQRPQHGHRLVAGTRHRPCHHRPHGIDRARGMASDQPWHGPLPKLRLL